MDAISPVYLLLGAVVCSMIGRFMLIRAAWEISKGWGIAVLCVPLAPMFFRMRYKELAGEGKNWLHGATAFGIGFVALTGSAGSIDELWTIVPERFRPAEYAAHRSDDAGELIPESAADEEETDPETAATESNSPSTPVATLEPKAAPEEKATFFARITSRIKGGTSEPAKSAASIVVAAPPPPAGPSLAERLAANQAEFARLGEVYEGLKKERGYLKKWDQDQIKAYNQLAAKYQADLSKARADQLELNKQVALVRK